MWVNCNATVLPPTPVHRAAGAQTHADRVQGITYQGKGLDLGFFNKRIGNSAMDGGAFTISHLNPFSTTNIFVNYTVRRHSLFDAQTKLRITTCSTFTMWFRLRPG